MKPLFHKHKMVSFNNLAFLSLHSTFTKKSVLHTSLLRPHFSRRGNRAVLPIALLTSIGLSLSTHSCCGITAFTEGIPSSEGSSHHSIKFSNRTTSRTSKTRLMSSSSTIPVSQGTIETGYLNAKDAYDLDQHLFANGYTLEQLMELAGLAVAEAVYQCAPPQLDGDSEFDAVKILVSDSFPPFWKTGRA